MTQAWAVLGFNLVGLVLTVGAVGLSFWTLRQARKDLARLRIQADRLDAAAAMHAEAICLLALVAQQKLSPEVAQQHCAAFLARHGISVSITVASPAPERVQ